MEGRWLLSEQSSFTAYSQSSTYLCISLGECRHKVTISCSHMLCNIIFEVLLPLYSELPGGLVASCCDEGTCCLRFCGIDHCASICVHA